jgi:hypothetical protein
LTTDARLSVAVEASPLGWIVAKLWSSTRKMTGSPAAEVGK